jgi:hypothetical protein
LKPALATESSTAELGSYRLLDHEFRVEADDPKVGRLIHRLLESAAVRDDQDMPPYSLTTSHPDRPGFWVWFDGKPLQEFHTAVQMIDFFLLQINTRSLYEVEGFVAIHAGSVARDGLSLILPAAPDSGKTTLTAGLVRAGFDYLSDEAALIDPATVTVHPFPRPLWMSGASVDAIAGLRQSLPHEYHELMNNHFHIRPADLRPDSHGQPGPLRWIVAPKYTSETTVLEPVSRAEGLKILIENTFNFQEQGRDAFGLLSKVVTGAESFRLSIGDLESAVDVLTHLVEKG